MSGTDPRDRRGSHDEPVESDPRSGRQRPADPAEPADRERAGNDAPVEPSLPRSIGTWPRAYALVLAALAVEVVLFWLLGAVYGGPS